MTNVLYYGTLTQVHSGASQWMYRMADQMRDFDYQVTAVLPSDEGIAEWYENSGIETVEFWSEPLRRRRSYLGHLQYFFFGLLAVLRLSLYVRRNEMDIVHVNDIRFFPGLIAGKLGGATCICHVRANYQSEIIRRILSGFILLFSDRVLCVSERTREIMFEEVDLPIDEVEVLYDAVPDPERFDGDIDDGSFREELGIAPDDTLILNVSKMTENKAQDRVLDAAERVTNRVENVAFVLVGGAVDGHEAYANTICNRASEIDAVHLAGFIPDITNALAASNISIHVPRHEDPFPGVVLEGMLAGNPVIGSRSGGIPEQIDDGETGYVVPKQGGTATIVDRITHLCQNDDERESMGTAAANRCREKFPPERHFESLNTLYENELAI